MSTDHRSASLLAAVPDVSRGGVGAHDVVRLETSDLAALLALHARRVRWMNARGIDQWRAPGDAIGGEDVRARFAALLRAGGVFGVRSAGGLLASVCLDTTSPLWIDLPPRHDGALWYLEKLMSDPEAGLGVGSDLLAWVEAQARRVGVAELRADCMADAVALQRFWQSRDWLPRRTATHASGATVLLHDLRLRPLAGPEGPMTLGPDALSGGFDGAWRATLLFVVRDDRVLLIHKKRGHGAGNINGPGGKLDPGETPRACAVREVREELCIDVAEPEYRGELRFVDTDGERIHGYVFVSQAFEGTPTETDEAIPEWFSLDAVPWTRMWADDRMWLPWVLRGEGVRAAFLTDRGQLEMARLAFGAGAEPA